MRFTAVVQHGFRRFGSELMMGAVRGWLLGLTAAAILAAIAESMMPEGSVKQVGKLVCGLMLAATVLRPLGSVEMTDFPPLLEYDKQQTQLLQEEADARMKTIIEGELSAYSMDKAAQLGIGCQIQIHCEPGGEGVFQPDSAEIFGELDEAARHQLTTLLCTDLGLQRADLHFRGEESG